MPGPYSSEGSLRDARQLAENLGIEFLTLPITDALPDYRSTLAPAFTGRAEDATEENIQARIRGNFLMALSNKFGSLVLSTGNKSEMAVGYCTLYGDMAGGLAVISDVPKTMVYELSKFVNRKRELIPRETLLKAPSAELRPNQKDQDTLPDYAILDRILKAYVEDVRSPEEIADHYQSPARPGALGGAARGPKRIQAQASPSGPESHLQSLQRRPPLPARPEILKRMTTNCFGAARCEQVHCFSCESSEKGVEW